MLALVQGRPFGFEPGKGHEYNNTGYFLLGMVLEKLHGKSYAQIVHDELCAPLGLERTRYDSNKELIKNRAQGYSLVDGKPANDDALSPNHPYAAGSLLSTGGDLVRWSLALAGGKVLSAASYTAMTTPLVVDGRDTHYGFGLMTGTVAELPTVMHGGGIHGFNSFLLHVPQPDLHVAVISNAERANAQKLAEAIVRAVLDIAEFVAKDLPLPAAQRDACVGVYDFPEVGMALHVTADGEKLQAKGDADGPAGVLAAVPGRARVPRRLRPRGQARVERGRQFAAVAPRRPRRRRQAAELTQGLLQAGKLANPCHRRQFRGTDTLRAPICR